ncbi:hypothetical protein [Parathalassolituus penaei]|uniref:Uncharacterized protein n=1 Tax=Parathalassolituus penaei TaxID=2997323 RepID=A0A9X3ECV8_9GAMM|nr:hypothetical protein [Parathalassolituus penaei]MCY0965247.1 hypothetical protein [Parathalassolituus penaei]
MFFVQAFYQQRFSTAECLWKMFSTRTTKLKKILYLHKDKSQKRLLKSFYENFFHNHERKVFRGHRQKQYTDIRGFRQSYPQQGYEFDELLPRLSNKRSVRRGFKSRVQNQNRQENGNSQEAVNDHRQQAAAMSAKGIMGVKQGRRQK